MRTTVSILIVNVALTFSLTFGAGCSDETNTNARGAGGTVGQAGTPGTGPGTGGAMIGGTGGATGGAGAGPSGAMCNTSLKDKYPWPAVEASVSCVKTCGPDGIGTKACNKVPAATCASGSSSCAATCPSGDCALCVKCTYPPFTGTLQCYAPPAGAPSACATAAILDGTTPCTAGTDVLCTQPDATGTKTQGCVCCSGDGTWTCATWDSLLNSWGI